MLYYCKSRSVYVMLNRCMLQFEICFMSWICASYVFLNFYTDNAVQIIIMNNNANRIANNLHISRLSFSISPRVSLAKMFSQSADIRHIANMSPTVSASNMFNSYHKLKWWNRLFYSSWLKKVVPARNLTTFDCTNKFLNKAAGEKRIFLLFL